MKTLILWGVFIFLLQGCGSSVGINSTTDNDKETVDASSTCIKTYNLQVGEKATYRFNVKGEISYLSAEVVSEDNENYTIAFTEKDKDTEYYRWLKDCQSNTTLAALEENVKVEYILRGIFSIEKYNSLQENDTKSSNIQQDTSTVSTGKYDRTEEWFEEYILESKIYKNVQRVFTQYSTSFEIAYIEKYIYHGEYAGIAIPIGDYIKYTIGYWDETNVTIELIEWNDL